MFNVLSIDGGGIRGVIPSVILHRLEKRTGKKIADLFDLIVGTSTGGIIAAALTIPKDGRPMHSAKDVLGLYTDRGRDIFRRARWLPVRLVDEKYDHKPLEQVLQDYLGSATLADCIKPIVVTSYDIESRSPVFFKTSHAQSHATCNFLLTDVVRATSAAPTYFEPKMIHQEGADPRLVLVDGGVVAVNPAMCAYVEARKSADANDILLVSLGTGCATRRIEYEEAKDWGYVEWAFPVLHMLLDGPKDAVDHQLSVLMGNEACGETRYFRFDTTLDFALDELDVATKGNIENLKREAQQILQEKEDDFKSLIKLLQ